MVRRWTFPTKMKNWHWMRNVPDALIESNTNKTKEHGYLEWKKCLLLAPLYNLTKNINRNPEKKMKPRSAIATTTKSYASFDVI